MTGDYSRFTFDPRKRFSGVLQQQGRVQLDADWNEAVSIFKRRIRLQARDTFGPVGVPYLTTPDAFEVSVVAGPPLDLALKPGRIYVDGILAELLADETASYLKQPFLPDPPPLPTGDVLVYLDLWDREVTYVEDPALLEPALGGVDTATRTQAVWQLKVDARQGATCGMTVGAPASPGRLTTEAIAPPTPDDPCILPPVAGYRGLENRLYRIEIHNGGALGTARFKWSRDNGSIVSAVSDIAVSGGQTTLTVNRLGRDQVLRFVVGNWVTVTDDFRELAGEPGEMARIISIDEANAKLVLDRGVPSSGGRAFGSNASELANRHTRVQRWDQSAPTNAVDADGLIPTAAGPIAIEEGIRVSFSVDPVGGAFNEGDYWVFWARTATASIEILNAAPPRGIHHHYVQLAAVTGLGGTPTTETDCRPAPPQIGEQQCCCTFVVVPGQDIQKAIDSLPPAGGCICLKTGLHVTSQTLTIERSNIKLVGESPGTTVLVRAALPVLMIGLRTAVQNIVVSGIAFERDIAGNGGAVIEIGNAIRVSIEDCAARSADPTLIVGVSIQNVQQLAIARCIIEQLEMGIWVFGKDNLELALVDNFLALQSKATSRPGFGILAQQVQSRLRIEGNVVTGAPNGILINDAALTDPPASFTQGAEIIENWVSIVAVPPGAVAPPAFGIDSAASAARVSGNMVLLPGGGTGPETGLRLTGTDLQATGNTVLLPGERNNSQSVGIQLGHSPAGSIGDVAVSGNEIVGCALAINGSAISGADISGNLLEGGPSRSPTVISGGIILLGCIGVLVHDNRAVGFSIAIGSGNGIANRFAGNIIATGNAGMLLTAETTPVVAQNRITDMQQLGIGAGALIARCDVTDNRIAACGYITGTGSVPSSIAINGIHGELNIRGNEVIDTGVPLAGSPIAPVYGVYAIGVQEATIEGNEVTYTSPEKRDVSAEDRALLIQGLTEVDTSIQILGNKFVGAGRSALVELLEIPPNGATVQGFERVICNNNHFRHFADVVPPLPPNSATVRLTGRAATVVGNQIKADRQFPSIDFNNMPGPFMGNVISGPVTRHTEFPAPIGAFNLTFA
jgi:hypothetical protein